MPIVFSVIILKNAMYTKIKSTTPVDLSLKQLFPLRLIPLQLLKKSIALSLPLLQLLILTPILLHIRHILASGKLRQRARRTSRLRLLLRLLPIPNME